MSKANTKDDYCYVWRVENAEGKGPYSIKNGYNTIHGERYSDGRECWSEYGRHPTPSCDGLSFVAWDHWRFAFASRAQFHLWFEKDACARLAGLGFHLARYRVRADDMRHGRKQCVFVRDKAILIETEQLTGGLQQ